MNNFGDDSNPFAAANPRPPTISNPSTNNNNRFVANNTPVQPTAPKIEHSTPAAYLPSEQTTPYSQARTPASAPVQQPAATRVDLSEVDKQRAELDERERRLLERERAVAASNTSVDTGNNFPPFPKWCPCKPCFRHDISADIPTQFQRWVRIVFYFWLIYVITFLFNTLTAMGFMVLAFSDGFVDFIVAGIYFVVCIPLSYLCWFRPLYRAFKNDSSFFFMVFFVMDFFFIGVNILFALGLIYGMCGFFKLRSLPSDQNGLKIMMAISGVLWSLVVAAAIVLTIKIHRLYRQSGASIERAQEEFQTTVVNSPTVQNAARDVATASINNAINSDEKQRVIH